MKKYISFFTIGIFFFLASVSNAQSLQVFDRSGNNVSGNTLMVWGDSGYYSQMSIKLDVENITSSTLGVKSKLILSSMQPGSSYQFCFNGNCYIPPTLVCPTTASIASGGTDTTFVGDYKPKGNLGVSLITYVFYRTDIPKDTTFVIVQFNATAVGLEQYSNVDIEISNPYPNPASSQTSFDYNFPENSSASFTLSDIAGNIIKQIPIKNTKGILEVPISDISGGIYFYSFYIDGKNADDEKTYHTENKKKPRGAFFYFIPNSFLILPT